MNETNDTNFGALSAGTKLADYSVERVLGHGGFGITYLARDAQLDTLFAIKEFLPTEFALRSPSGDIVVRSEETREAFDWARQRFLKEARVLARFSHPNIVRISRYFEANGTVYFVMDYVEGLTLGQLIAEQAPLAEDRIKAILMPILSGLAEIHAEEILHRDIKPANIIVRSDDSPMLIDFGAARQSGGGATKSMFNLVSAGSAPIEQYTEDMIQGPWTDIYALGSVSYRMISGKRVPESIGRLRDDPLQAAAELGRGRYSKTFLAALDWALAVHPEDRPQNIEQWQSALEGRSKPPAPRRKEHTATRGSTEVLPGGSSGIGDLLASAGGGDSSSAMRRWLPPVLALLAGIAVAIPLLLTLPGKDGAQLSAVSGIARGEAMMADGDVDGLRALIDTRLGTDPTDAVAQLLTGHLAFERGEREQGAGAYAQALKVDPSLAENRILASNLVNSLGWATASVRPLIRAHRSSEMLLALAARTADSGVHGRNRAYGLLIEFGRPDLVDRVAYGRRELEDRKTCEEKIEIVRMLGDAGDVTVIPLLQQLVDGAFENRCLRKPVREAISKLN